MIHKYSVHLEMLKFLSIFNQGNYNCLTGNSDIQISDSVFIQAKDKAIVNLTHQVDENTSNVRPVSLPPSLTFTNHETTTRGTQTSSQQEDALKDALEAYRCQNTFLNKEILELNLLRKHCSEREQKLITYVFVNFGEVYLFYQK